jgi:hypothetical protein
VTSSAASAIASAERSRGPQLLLRDCGSADPLLIVSAYGSLPDAGQSAGFDAAIIHSTPTDRSLTYLQTGRLRL